MAGVFLAFVVVSRTTAELNLAGIVLKRLKMFSLYTDVVLQYFSFRYNRRVREGGIARSRDRRKSAFPVPGSILSLATH